MIHQSEYKSGTFAWMISDGILTQVVAEFQETSRSLLTLSLKYVIYLTQCPFCCWCAQNLKHQVSNEN